MSPNPALGVMIFVLGGLAGAVFYLPFKKVKNWAWESYWMIYAIVGLIVVPWVLALLTSPNIFGVLSAAPTKQVLYCIGCGMAWGIGGLTWGLMIRYLGVGLGLAIGCGLCSAGGTLIPPIINREFLELFKTNSGLVSLLGVLVSLVGIVLVGLAGMSKESELPEEEKKKAVAEYNFKKGLTIAIVSGLMSSAMNIGLRGGEAITSLATTVEPVTSTVWKGIPVLVVVLFGGFLVNAGYCLFLNIINKSMGDYGKSDSPIGANIFFAGLAGAIWCSQFICLKTGEPAMGEMDYVGWAVLMASAIMFSGLLGVILGEWKGTSGRTKSRLVAGLMLLFLTAVITGLSGYMSKTVAAETPQATQPAETQVSLDSETATPFGSMCWLS